MTLTLEYDAHFDDMFTVRGAEPGERGTLRDPETRGRLPRLPVRRCGRPSAHDDPHVRPETDRVRWSPYHLSAPPRARRCALLHRDHRRGGSREGAWRPRNASPGGRQGDERGAQARGGRIAQRQSAGRDEQRALQPRTAPLLPRPGDAGDAAEGETGSSPPGCRGTSRSSGATRSITALETLAYDPAIARHTLDILARYQGTKVDEYRDEEPGKILHELRVGEKANLHEVPSTPYYGTIDATPLFLILLGEYVLWTGDLDYFTQTATARRAALAWMETYGDRDGDGFLAYASKSRQGAGEPGLEGLRQQHRQRRRQHRHAARRPGEVQGYAYRARRTLATVERHGATPTAPTGTEGGRTRYNSGSMSNSGCRDCSNYALALQKGQTPGGGGRLEPGAGALGRHRGRGHAAACVRDTLMDPDELFAGWGIRTLSHAAAAYNPFDYQVGAIWPHDNALIVAGLRALRLRLARRSRSSPASIRRRRISIYYRLPELFAGFGQDRIPRRRSTTRSRAARRRGRRGACPFMLQSVLGLVPDAFARQLRIVRPACPTGSIGSSSGACRSARAASICATSGPAGRPSSPSCTKRAICRSVSSIRRRAED